MDTLDCQKENKWALQQIKPEASWEAQMTAPKLFYLRHIMRIQSPLAKTVIWGETESSRPSMKWSDSMKTATGTGLQQPSRAAEDRTCGHHSFTGWPGTGAEQGHQTNANEEITAQDV